MALAFYQQLGYIYIVTDIIVTLPDYMIKMYTAMKKKVLVLTVTTLLLLLPCLSAIAQKGPETRMFDSKKDLLLAQFDCKTDVDDLHTVAGFFTLLRNSRFSSIKYHAVAGTYGIQEGLYVPANELFQAAFGKNWSDAHSGFEKALQEVYSKSAKTLKKKGDIWIAEAGQSDFTAALIRKIQTGLPTVNTSLRIHVVQHSNWNEEVTSPDRLAFVKSNSDYRKIPDGNVTGNGSPGFRNPGLGDWESRIGDTRAKEIWTMAVSTANIYNGKDGRYKNEAVSAGGLDFSDLSETCYILGSGDLKDGADFFERFGMKKADK